MRLLRLKLRNIASLKGEHEINFKEIQNASPLFAITGETGSGKSSILNSIGLALYGEIYKKSVNQIDVVTLGEKEGEIQLIFQVKGKSYLADWRVRVLKQNGEPYAITPSPVRTLYQLEGTDFSSPKTATKTTASELLNLDFDQFSRCIILNQGEFAKFLTSTFKERKDILEKLYPGELLDSLSRELESEKKSLEKARHELEIELQAIQGDHISGDLLKTEKDRLQKELKELTETFDHLERLSRHFTSLSSYHTNFGENKKRQENIKNEIDQETTKFNHLLKSGETIHERYQKIKIEHETNLPRYQLYLKKEEELKHTLVQTNEQQGKRENIQKELQILTEKIQTNEKREKELKIKMEEEKKSLSRDYLELKKFRSDFHLLFDLFNEKEILTGKLSSEEENLNQLAERGKELKALFDETQKNLLALPSDSEEALTKVTREKELLQKRIEDKARAQTLLQELKKQQGKALQEKGSYEESIESHEVKIKEVQAELLPLETTLRLQEVLTASHICIEHGIKENKESCPVCESPVNQTHWTELKKKLDSIDLAGMQNKFNSLSLILEKSKREQEFYKEKVLKLNLDLNEKNEEVKKIVALTEENLPSPQELEEKIAQFQQHLWKKETLSKEKAQRENDLNKTREQYLRARKELDQKKASLQVIEEKLSTLSQSFGTLISEINKESVRSLREDARLLNTCLEIETLLEKSLQEKEHLIEKKERLEKDLNEVKKALALGLGKIQNLREELQEALGGAEASVLIKELNEKLKTATEAWTTHQGEQSKQEQTVRRSQGRLYELEELLKGIDLKFTQERLLVREVAGKEIPLLSHDLFGKLKNIDLTLDSPHELFVPLEETLAALKTEFKEKKEQTLSDFSAVSARLSDWEKLQDRVALLSLKAKDINETLSRKERLFEVLGKDELRTFVLSLVEENLIHQTNLELQKLCQGRYEIIHQVKSLRMTPEFYILDKFREGGQRKVSTLSGGETFMVSLAMALGLAELTRGQAEIESLFIDEGFGTLDHESLEDVLDMLQQIQNRGLMVGLISHIKTLTQALPVNLLLSKKQDGTSSVSVKYN